MTTEVWARFESELRRVRRGTGHVVRGGSDHDRTAICVRFLQQALESGEAAVLVTERPPDKVIEQAKRQDCDLATYVAEHRLLIFEYPEDIETAVGSDQDHAGMIEEFRNLLAGQKAARVAFDPITPLSCAGGKFAARRFAALVDTCTELELTTLFVLGGGLTASAERQAVALVNGEMRLDLAAEQHKHVEPEAVEAEAIRPGWEEDEAEWAPVERAVPPMRQIAAAPEARDGKEGPRILLIEPDATRRLTLRAQLERNFSVIEASGLNDGLTLATVGKPDALLIAMEIPGASGLEAARMLRERGVNSLIVGVGEMSRRTTDQIAALAAGIDVCFSADADPRLLRLTLLNLLQRTGAVARGRVKQEAERIARRPEPEGYPCTSDFSQFNGRIARETLYARENGLPFVIVTFRLPDVPLAVEELASQVASQTRLPDLVYVGPCGLACLLAEAQSARPFLNRLWSSWRGGYAPAVEEYRFVNQDAFLQKAREFVISRVGVHAERKPPAIAAPAPRRLVSRRFEDAEDMEFYEWEREAPYR